MASLYINTIKSLKPIHDSILITEMNFDERITTGGIVIPGDDARNSGIRPRWGRVFAVGPDQHDVKIGDWICVSHGRWTRGVTIDDNDGEKIIRRVDPNDILLISEIKPNDDSLSDKV